MRSAAVWVAPSRYELPLWLQVGVACYSGCLTVVRVAQRMALDTLRGVLRAPANCVHVLTLAALLDGTGNACSYPEFVAHSNIVHRVYQHHPLTRLACWCWYVCVPSWASMQGCVAQLTCGTVIWAARRYMLARAEPQLEATPSSVPLQHSGDRMDDLLHAEGITTVIEEGSSDDEHDAPLAAGTSASVRMAPGAGAGAGTGSMATTASRHLMGGAWQCNVCTVVNPRTTATCQACGMGINTQTPATPGGHAMRRAADTFDPASIFPSGGVDLGAKHTGAVVATMASLRNVWSHRWAFDQIRKLLVQQVQRVRVRVCLACRGLTCCVVVVSGPRGGYAYAVPAVALPNRRLHVGNMRCCVLQRRPPGPRCHLLCVEAWVQHRLGGCQAILEPQPHRRRAEVQQPADRVAKCPEDSVPGGAVLRRPAVQHSHAAAQPRHELGPALPPA